MAAGMAEGGGDGGAVEVLAGAVTGDGAVGNGDGSCAAGEAESWRGGGWGWS